MKGSKLLLTAAVAFTSLFSACDQNPIFYSISNETERAEPVVEGTPTRIVSLGGILYVANGSLYRRSDASWTTSNVNEPGDHQVRDLAASSTELFALTVDGSGNDTRLWRSSDGLSWTALPLAAAVASYDSFDSIFVADDVLYVGAHAPDASKSKGFAWAVLRWDGSELVSAIEDLDDGGYLSGAAYDGTVTYLATVSRGIYSFNGTTASLMTDTDDYSIQGIAAFGASVLAVSSDEKTLIKLAAASDFVAHDHNASFTGAIGSYDADNDGVSELALVGVSESGTYGYREFALSSGAFSETAPDLSKPNAADSSVEDYEQYAASIGVVPVRHLRQVWADIDNDTVDESVLLASTYLQGLWSSTDRGSWNLEE